MASSAAFGYAFRRPSLPDRSTRYPATAMYLSCPSCRATIPADDVHLPSGRARCRACNAVFRLAGSEAAAPPPPPRAPRPPEVTETAGPYGVSYVRRWWGRQFVFLTAFSVVWMGFLAIWYSIALRGDDVFMLLFPLLHLAAGVGITYYTICGYLNRTVVAIDRDRLTVRHGPLPWPGNRDLPISGIRQMYCEAQTHRTRNGTSLSYRLSAVLDDGSSIRLVSGLDSPDLPRYLEQVLEERLRIANAPVAGELSF